MSKNQRFVVGLGVFAMFWMVMYSVTHSDSPRSAALADSTTTSQKPSWVYDDQKDDLTDKVDHVACLFSTNRVEFGRPYDGGATGRLCFRRSGKKLDSYFAVDRGQMLCHYDGCTLHARFDDGPVQGHHSFGSRTGGSKILFPSNTATLLKQVRTAHRVRLATDFYQEGERTFEFEPAGLDESKLK